MCFTYALRMHSFFMAFLVDIDGRNEVLVVVRSRISLTDFVACWLALVEESFGIYRLKISSMVPTASFKSLSL